MLDSVFRSIGFGLCHQLPERSFFGGGVQLPVCARDTGIYIGFVVAMALLVFLHRGERPARFPSPVGWVVIGALFATMAWDGLSSYAGFRESNNLLRLATGVSAGFAVAAVVLPLLNSELFARRDDVRVLTPWQRLAVWTACVPVTIATVWFLGPLLGIAYPILVTGAILATFITVNMLFAAILPAFDRKVETARDLLGPVAIGFVLTVVEFVGAALLRIALESAARAL